MFPFNFEWTWEMTRIVFMGGLHYAMTIITLGLAYCVIKAVYDTCKGKDGQH